MKRFKLQKVTKSVIATALALVITIGALPIGHVFATGSGKNNPDIQKIENIALDYSKYFDSSVVFKLPDTINADDEISVIITTDDNAVIDVYEGSDKTMSLSDFALKSNYAKAAKQKLAKSKAEVLAELDKKNISYKIGEEYSTILNGRSNTKNF